MSINIDKRLILSEIKSHYNFKTDKEFADFLDTTPQTISSWKARNMFDFELLYSKCVGIDANFLFTGKGNPWRDEIILQKNSSVAELGLPRVVTVNEHDEEMISLVNVKAAAGYLNGYADPEYIERLPTIHIPGLKGGTHRAFENIGHSMSPTFHNKSISIGRWVEDFNDIRDRFVYIVVTKSEGVVIKRVLNRIEERGQLVLISDNHHRREYPNIVVDADEVIELWKVRTALSFEFPEPTQWQERFNDLEAQVTFLAEHFKLTQNQIKQ